MHSQSYVYTLSAIRIYPSTAIVLLAMQPSFPDHLALVRAWTEQEIEPGVMIAVMEAVMEMVKSHPDFEARRLARKSAVKFRY